MERKRKIFFNISCVFLTLIILLSTFLAGTYAWQTSVHQENPFSGEKAPRTGLSITKMVANANRTAPTDAQKAERFTFTVTLSAEGAYAYAIDGTAQEETIASGGKIVLRHGQIATISGLPVGTRYSVAETPVSGYTVSGEHHQGEVTAQGARADFINTYAEDHSETIIISGEKTWVHGNNPEANRPKSIVVSIKDGDRVVIQQTITAANEWRWSFRLPKYDDAGTEISYALDEATVYGYTKAIRGYNVTNTYVPPDEPDPDPDPGKPTDPTNPPPSGKPSVPKTGDNSHMAMWFVLIIAGAFALRWTLNMVRPARKKR